jgi:glycosyltransferase involved in cell wall biosynthesis
MLNHEFPPVGGGASPVTFELCRQLASLGHQVDVVTMHYGDLPRVEQVSGFTIYRTPAIRKRPNICYTHELATYVPGALRTTLRLARQNKYDIIHCHFMVPGAPLAYLVNKFTKIPYIVTCHGSDVPGHNPDRFGLMHRLIGPFWRLLASRPALLTSPSNSLKEKILHACPRAKIEVIPNGIYYDNFDPSAKSRSILMCSRVFKFKGFQYALEALARIRPDWEINMIGQGPYLPELQKQAADLKLDVHFHGWIDRADKRFYELFNKSSIFIFPSEAENFPAVLLEALSAGSAIITSTAGGCPEIVGEAAILVPPRDPARIEEALSSLLNSDQLRNKLSLAALARAREFAWPLVAGKYVDCYLRVISEKKP